MFQQQYEALPAIAAEPSEQSAPWPPRRKLVAIMAASLVAWMVWGGAALLAWRVFAS